MEVCGYDSQCWSKINACTSCALGVNEALKTLERDVFPRFAVNDAHAVGAEPTDQIMQDFFMGNTQSC